MSEVILKSLLRLFAVVARQDEVTRQEREQVRLFLREHLNESKIELYLSLFDEYAGTVASVEGADEAYNINRICAEINLGLTQKQKYIVVLELVRLVLADDTITPREDDLLKLICKSFNVSNENLESIKTFLAGKESAHLDHPALLIVDGMDDTAFKHALHIKRNHLKGFIEFLYISEAELYLVKYIGMSEVYLNGVPFRSGSIQVLSVGSTLRWDKDEPIYYGDVLSRFKRLNVSERISFEGKDIHFKFKNGGIGLQEINLAEESGNLVALMGASGSGKSTLLHVLNGSEKPTRGKVLINGIDIHKEPEKIEGVIGFVPQDDLLIEDLTVYQNLYYAAKLCFSDLDEASIDSLVMKTLEDLGLAERKDLKVGSPLQKTISGGQRKRLNIGLELLREPAILFCDEPTSGLSSRDSENIIDLLKELALKGKLVFAVIHQPSSDIFKKFDRLLILDTGGYQIYYGNPVDAIVYFKRAIDMINSEMGECFECGNVNPEQIFNIIETKVINEYGQFTNERKMLPEQWFKLYQLYKKIGGHTLASVSSKPVKSTLRIPGRLKQTKLFSLRDVQAKIHNRQYMIINLLEAPVLAFILAFIVRFYNVDDKLLSGYVFAKNLNLPAYLFMSVIVALFMGLTVSAEEIIRDRKILKREAFLHLSRSSYLMSKIGILFLLSAIQTLSFVIVGNYILEIRGMLLEHWLIMFTVSCFANVLGLNISSGFNSAVTIYILIPLLIIPQLILSGVVVKFDKLNPVIGNTATVPFVGDLMASRWAFEAGMVTQFKDNRYEQKFYYLDKIMADADYKKIYYIPELETKLQFCLNNLNTQDDDLKRKLIKDLDLLRNEIRREAEWVERDHYEWIDNIAVNRFDSTTYSEAINFLGNLRRLYINRYNKADGEKEKKISQMTDTPEKAKSYAALRDGYRNEAIADFVKNLTETHRIIEKDGKLIQKIYPIYKDPDPDHFIDFDAQFYMPKKHFLNRNIDTLFFNTGVIWSMSFVLMLTLYFDLLRRVIDGIGNLSNPLNRRM
ncbi:MAG TPA: ATP-binding cassette domain-containing protein [Cyclobacteriaceae bacterium]|nr:ATP-binding cassette domain-containing protein [Cyclobacteriaceae bacterium]HRJ82380.1 ATP-binding cassette domain-containing protein [Cyclobacteriaceae bacterium]